MALEVQIGADSSDLNAELAAAEAKIKRLSALKVERVKLGLDTKELSADIADAKAKLNDLKKSVKSTGDAFNNSAKPIGNAGNTLTQFSRIAQDAPFGIMGIGNNLTATAEAFSNLSKQSGGAGNALKAVAGSLMGGGGLLLAVSLVTTALTVMSQKGITVGDVFNKLSGNFDQFKKDLQEVNREAAKNAAEQVASVGAYVSAAKDINLSMSDRLIAVKKLQQEYPAFFGNLTKEQILNGNVANAVNDVVAALKAKARSQAYAGKLGDLAAKEVELRDKEALLIEQHNKTLTKRIALEKQLASSQFNEGTFKAQQQASRALETYKEDLKEVQDAIRANSAEMDKWAKKSTIEVKASIKLDFKEEKLKKVKQVFETPQVAPILVPIKVGGFIIEKFDIEKAINAGVNHKTGIFSSLIEDMEASRIKFIERLKTSYTSMSQALIDFNRGLREVMLSGTVETFSSLGNAIGEALANGGNVLKSVGASLINSMGSILSAIGDKLIALGTASLLASTVFSTFGTALGVGAAIAAIAGGVALKAGGSILTGNAKNMSGGGKNGMSAGNSITTPTSSTNNIGGGGGFQNVVFEISGQSLVGVLSNTLNRNVKLGGTPAI